MVEQRTGGALRSEIMGRVAADMLSVPPLIFRLLRSKLIKTTLAGVDGDIHLPHFEIMRVLREEGTLHVARIGERLHIAKAQMTHLIDKLVELDLVARQMDATDRRTVNIALTEGGLVLMEEHRANLVNAVREYMSALTDDELETLSISLRNLRDILAKAP
jgi:MarR family transcriptional regulator, 2-MHQ and catechol-resistance regulon repressor